MNKDSVVHPYNRTLPRNKKQGNTGMYNNLDDSEKQFAKW